MLQLENQNVIKVRYNFWSFWPREIVLKNGGYRPEKNSIVVGSSRSPLRLKAKIGMEVCAVWTGSGSALGRPLRPRRKHPRISATHRCVRIAGTCAHPGPWIEFYVGHGDDLPRMRIPQSPSADMQPASHWSATGWCLHLPRKWRRRRGRFTFLKGFIS